MMNNIYEIINLPYIVFPSDFFFNGEAPFLNKANLKVLRIRQKLFLYNIHCYYIIG